MFSKELKQYLAVWGEKNIDLIYTQRLLIFTESSVLF